MYNAKKMMTAAAVFSSLLLCGSAFASGGSNTGGVNSGGGGGKAADGVSGVVVTLNNGGQSYNGKLPQGTVTLGYAADGSAQSMSFNLSNINVPDGTVLPVQVITGTLQTIFTYYQISQVVYTETDGSITISHGAAKLTLSKLNGDVVPDFPSATPGSGTTEISILSPDGSIRLLDGIEGSFHA